MLTPEERQILEAAMARIRARRSNYGRNPEWEKSAGLRSIAPALRTLAERKNLTLVKEGGNVCSNVSRKRS